MNGWTHIVQTLRDWMRSAQPERAETKTIAASTGQGLAAPHGIWVLIVLSVLLAFASISTDLYLPAMPIMGVALHASAGMIAMTISGYLIGFSLGQLFWGPVSDRYGRRTPIAAGLVLFIVGSAGCALSNDAFSMIAWRLVQAVGASAGVVLARAMVRDLFEGANAARMLSRLMTVMAIAPLLGPVLGGQILLFASWRAIFWTLVGVGIVTLVAIFTLSETLPPDRRHAEKLGRALVAYLGFLRDRRLISYAGSGGFLYGGLFANIAGSPFAYISFYHIAPQLYGFIFAAGVMGIMGANIANVRLVTRVGSDNLLVMGTAGAALAGIVAAKTASTGWGGWFGLAIPLFFFISMMGFIVANAIAGALEDFPQRAGMVSALVGAIQYGGGILGSALIGALADGTPGPLGLVVALCGVGSLTCALRSVRGSK